MLGELIIARIHLAALTRLERPREERRPFYLVVDESQRFQGASLPILLSEGRKLGLPLLLSTQYLQGWSEALAESVLSNVGTQVVFRSGPSDARRLSAAVKPFTAEQIENLDRYEAIVKMQVYGLTAPAFDLRTLPLPQRHDGVALGAIRAQTRSRYARPRAEVEAEIAAKYRRLSEAEEHEDVDED